MIYDIISSAYDKINSDIDYKSWADFMEEIFRREYKLGRPELLLDLGCGTGRMTFELARRGYDMTGVDFSPEMLNIAREEEEKQNLQKKVLWLCQDISEFELYGTVDSAVCCLDTVNHITNKERLAACFNLVHNYLIPDGLFIFDVNGKHKFENTYASESYVFEESKEFLVWQNFYNKRNHICDFYITLFREGKDGRYDRFDGLQKEKMYKLRTLKKMLDASGFEFVGAYSNFEFEDASDDSERIYIVARCKK